MFKKLKHLNKNIKKRKRIENATQNPGKQNSWVSRYASISQFSGWGESLYSIKTFSVNKYQHNIRREDFKLNCSSYHRRKPLLLFIFQIHISYIHISTLRWILNQTFYMLIWLFFIVSIIQALNCRYNNLPMLHRHLSGSDGNSQQMKIGGYTVWKGEGQRDWGVGLLYLTGGGRGCLAAHAGRVDWFGWDQIQVFVIRDLV